MNNFKKKRRLGFLMHGIFYGGASRSLIHLIKRLSETTIFDIYVYTSSISSKNVKKEFEKCVKVIRIVKLDILTANQAYISNPYQLKKINTQNISNFVKLLLEDDIEIIHINTTVFSHTLGAIKSKTNIKVIVHVRELIPINNDIGQFIINEIKKYADFVICISENEEKLFMDFENRKVIPNTLEFEEIDKVKKNIFRKKLKIDESTILVTMSSHFYKPKGHLIFLDALKLLIEKYNKKNVLFIIVGAKLRFYYIRKLLKRLLHINDYLSEVINTINRQNIKRYIKIIPYTYNIYPIIKDSDIIVRPALTADPWGRDVIEGMAFSKPIIATGTSTFYISPNNTGFLVNPDSYELADKINKLIEDKSLRIKFGKNGRRRIEKICDPISNTNEIIRIYNEL